MIELMTPAEVAEFLRVPSREFKERICRQPNFPKAIHLSARVRRYVAVGDADGWITEIIK